MQKKIFLQLCLAAGIVGIASCSGHSSLWNDGEYEYRTDIKDSVFSGQYMTEEEAQAFVSSPREAAKIFNKRVPPLNSLIVCRDKQCAPAELSMSKEYIFNSLAHLTDNNLDATALLCEANPQAHVCINPYLTVPAKIGVTPAYVFFDGVKFVDASTEKGKTAINIALGYNLSYNGQTPTVCKPDKALLYVKSNNEVVLNGNGFKCDMTSVGTTTIRIMFDIDYIDLDYGYIGGYYSIGLSGPANGGGTGYGMIRLQKDAHPLNPVLMGPEDEDNMSEDVVSPSMPVKPDVKSEAINSSMKEPLAIDDEQVSKALAPVEVIEQGKQGAVENNTPVQEFRRNDDRMGVNAARPLEITPDSVVRSDRLVIRPENDSSGSSYEVKSEDYGPEFEEIYIDDLDEYIK